MDGELTLDERIRNVINYLNDEIKKEVNFIKHPEIKATPQMVENIRIMLGIDEMCFHCRQYKFKFELSSLDGMAVKVCQDCAEKILNGEEQLSEDYGGLH